MWRWRGLKLLGRIQIVKTFAIPKFMYKASLISVSEDLIQEMNKNKLLYGLIWKGNDKIKRTALINDIENGGLKMLDIQSMILSQRVIALKRFIEDYNSKRVLETFLGDIGGRSILCCNFDTRKLPIYLPDFYKECLDARSDVSATSVVSYDDVVNQTIWNDKFILIENKSCYIEHLAVHGIVKIGDLISDNGRFLESEKSLQARLFSVHFFKLMGIVNSIPNKWKLIIKQSQHHICSPSNDTFQINIENATVNVLKVTSKMLYNEFRRKKQTVIAAQKKIELKYPDLSLEWKDIYSLPFTVAHDTKTREFQYKLLNNIVFTNDKLFRFKMIDSPLCAFCQTEVESPEHLFFHCNVTKSFWQLLCSRMSEQKVISTPLTLENVIFGVFNIVEDFHILNHTILLA